MANKYSEASEKRLESCAKDLQVLFRQVLPNFDHTIICGHRGQAEQDRAYVAGNSKLKFPNSKHNKLPSIAVDVAPFLNGKPSYDKHHCVYFAGYVMAVADYLHETKAMEHRVRWGGDWDSDNEAVTDQTFQDLVHFELIV